MKIAIQSATLVLVLVTFASAQTAPPPCTTYRCAATEGGQYTLSPDFQKAALRVLAILKYPNPAPGESWSPAVRDAAQLDLAATAGTQNEECIKQKLMVALTLEGINGKAMDEEEYFKIKAFMRSGSMTCGGPPK